MSNLDDLGEVMLLGSIYANSQQQSQSIAELSHIMAINAQILTIKSTEEQRLKERRDLLFNIRKSCEQYLQSPHSNIAEAAFEWTLLSLYFYGGNVNPSHFSDLSDKEYAFQTEKLLTEGRNRALSQLTNDEQINMREHLHRFLHLDELNEYSQLLAKYHLHLQEAPKPVSKGFDQGIGCLSVAGIIVLLYGIGLFLSGLFGPGIVILLIGAGLLWGVKTKLDSVPSPKLDLPHAVRERYKYLKSKHGEPDPHQLTTYIVKTRESIDRYMPTFNRSA